MKLDEFLPNYDIRSQHSIEVRATPAETYAALTTGSFSQIALVRFLMRLRGFARQRTNVGMRESLRRGGFFELCDIPAQEIAYGIAGQFWRLSGGRKVIESTEQFMAFAEPGCAKVAWNFVFAASSSQTTQLRTETRIRTFGPGASWKFRTYWSVIAPFSGLLRRAILRDVKRRAEHLHQREAAEA